MIKLRGNGTAEQVIFLFFFSVLRVLIFFCAPFFVSGYDNITGETLHFVRVDRKMQGAHFCLASNGVPPTKSKRIVLDVNCMTYLCPLFLLYFISAATTALEI